MATTDKVTVNRSATVGLNDTTLEGFTTAASKVGAPKDARISTGGAVQNGIDVNNNPTYYTQSVTFSWSEEV